MVACLVIGLAWIALYYVTNGNMAGISALGYWNMVIGFALIIGGVVLSTRWRLARLPGRLPPHGQNPVTPIWPLRTMMAMTSRASTATVAAPCTRNRRERGA
jgi:hypothetical protein